MGHIRIGHSRVLVLTLAALTAAALAGAANGDEPRGQVAEVWDLGTLERGGVHATTLAAHNESCPGRREFIFSIDGAPWLRLTGSDRVVAGPGETATTPAEVDLTRVAPGTYENGRVVARCPKCPRKCHLDYREIHIRLTVTKLSAVEDRPVGLGDPAGSSGGVAPGTGLESESGPDQERSGGVQQELDDAGSELAEAWRQLEVFTSEHVGNSLAPDEVFQAYVRLWQLTADLRQAQEQFLGGQVVARNEELTEATRLCLEENSARLEVLVKYFSETLAKLQQQEAITDKAYARYNALLREHRKWRGITPPVEAIRNAGLVSQGAWNAKNEELKLRGLEGEADLKATVTEITRVQESIDECFETAIQELASEHGGILEPGPGEPHLLDEPYSQDPREDLRRSVRARRWKLDQLIDELAEARHEEMQRQLREAEKEKQKMRNELEEEENGGL